MNKEIDFDSDDVERIVTSYSSISEEVSSINVSDIGSSCDFIGNQCASVINTVTTETNTISETLSATTEPIKSILEQMKMIDEMDDDGVYSFSDILLFMSAKKQGVKIKRADKDFFEREGYQIIDGVVTIKSEEGEYSYNIETGLLTNPDGSSLYVNYYVPEVYDDLSKMNTITCLAGQGEADIYSTKGDNSFHMDEFATTSIIVCPSKKGQKEKGIDVSKASYSFMADKVINSTKFATLFINQREGCQNIIGGCSSGGGSALNIAGQAGDLYDTVFCINYAPLIKGKNDGGKGLNGGDDNRMTEDVARNLDGKNLIFFSSSGDANVDGDKKSKMYTGLELLIDYCPNSHIYCATNRNTDIYAELSGSNYQFLGEEFWKNFATNKGVGVSKGQYSGHGSYHGMLNDLINSELLAQNNYSSSL